MRPDFNRFKVEPFVPVNILDRRPGIVKEGGRDIAYEDEDGHNHNTRGTPWIL
jgi:hypothetical protein